MAGRLKILTGILWFFSLAAVTAHAGSSSGGGGSGIDVNGRLVLWDLFLADQGRSLPDESSAANLLEDDSKNFPLEISRVDLRWKWTDGKPIPNPSVGLAVRLIDATPGLSSTLKAFLRFTLQYNLIANTTSLPLAFDATGTYVPKERADVAKSLKTVSWFLPEIGVLFQRDRFNSMGRLSQAGLLIHESLRHIQLLVGPALSVREIQDLTAAICFRRAELLPKDFLEKFSELVSGDRIFEKFFGTGEDQRELLDAIHRAENRDGYGFIWAYSGDFQQMDLLERIQHFIDFTENRLRVKGLQLNLSGVNLASLRPDVATAIVRLRDALAEKITKDERQPPFDEAPRILGEKILTDLGGLKVEDDFGFDGKRRGVCGQIDQGFFHTKLIDSVDKAVRAHIERACQITPHATWQNRPSADQGLNEYVRTMIGEYQVSLMATRLGEETLRREGWTKSALQFLMYSARELWKTRPLFDAKQSKDSLQQYYLRQVRTVNALLRLYLIRERALGAAEKQNPADFLTGYLGD